MTEFILQMLETEKVATAILVFFVVAGGWFFTKHVWPWFTSRIDKTLDNWLELKRQEMKIEAERNVRYADAWQVNNDRLQSVNQRLLEVSMTIQTMLEVNKALIGTLLTFVDDEKLQGKLYSLFYNKEG